MGGPGTHPLKNRENLVQNHQVPVKTQWVSGSFVTTQFIWKQTVLNLTETKTYSFYCKAQKWLKEKTSFNNTHRNHTNRIFNKNIFRSSAALVGWHDLSGIGMRAVPFSVAHRHVFFKAQQRLKEKASSNNSHKNSHRNLTNTIFYKNIFRSSAALVGWRDLGGIGMRQSLLLSHTDMIFVFVFKFLDTIQINTIIFIYPCSIKFIMVQNMQIY